jgi:regulator of replication initiation timing
MNVFDGFEKLINEHGSAAILRDHLSLMKTQFAVLERENTKLTTENTELKAKIQTLETDNRNLKTENDKLKKKIGDYEKDEGGFSSGVIIS